MSALLRAYGTDFDVDSFINDTNLIIDKISRAGSPVRPTVAPNGRKIKRSGFNVVASKADFDDYKLQFKETFFFMCDNADELIRLANFPGVQSLVIDFGANIYPPGWCSFRFPHPLLRMAGHVKVDLELSVYPSDQDEGPKKESAQDRLNEVLDEAYEEFIAQKTASGEQGRR